MGYLEARIKGCDECECPTGPGQFPLSDHVDFLVGFHTEVNVKPRFEWADKFFGGDLPKVGRPKNCFISGKPGSGKSSLADLVAKVIPTRRVFQPTLDSSAPFSKLRNCSLLSTCDDFRFSIKVPVTGTLQWLEGRSFGLDVKGEDAIPIEMGPICPWPTNRGTPTRSWREVDIDAFKDRCYIANMENILPPAFKRNDISDRMDACLFCRIKSLAKRCLSVRNAWARIKGRPIGSNNRRGSAMVSGSPRSAHVRMVGFAGTSWGP